MSDNNIGEARMEWDMMFDYILEEHFDFFPEMNPGCTEEEFYEVYEGRLRNAMIDIIKKYNVEKEHWSYFANDIARVISRD